jgi:hypothetical protein
MLTSHQKSANLGLNIDINTAPLGYTDPVTPCFKIEDNFPSAVVLLIDSFIDESLPGNHTNILGTFYNYKPEERIGEDNATYHSTTNGHANSGHIVSHKCFAD